MFSTLTFVAGEIYTPCDVSVNGILCLLNGKYIAGAPATSRDLLLHLDFASSEPIDLSANAQRGFGSYGLWPSNDGINSSGLFDTNYVVIPTTEAPDFISTSISFGVSIINTLPANPTGKYDFDKLKLLYGRVEQSDSAVILSPAIFFNPQSRKLEVGISVGSVPGKVQMIESNRQLAINEEWYHITVVFSQKSMVYLYIDGTLDFAEALQDVPFNAPDLLTTVGQLPSSSLVDNQKVTVAIEKLQVWKRINGPKFIKAQASGYLKQSYVGNIRLGCDKCSRKVAKNACDQLEGFQLCSQVSLTTAGWEFVHKYGFDTDSNTIHMSRESTRESYGSRKDADVGSLQGIGLCCKSYLI